jgi:protoheme IX farnesyltransferase
MIRELCRLLRPRLALLNGIAALGGYLLFPAEPGKVALAGVLCGVTLLAAGGSALNQVQERHIDRLMARTQNRPIPRGDLTPAAATFAGLVTILAGLTALLAAGGWLPAVLGLAALAWYLGLYTPLKRRTSLALAVGALCGAFSPVIGWCSAGGNPVDFRVLLLAGLLYIWQIPHFWLFQRRHSEDFRRAGIMQFGTRGNGTASPGLCKIWIVALLAGAMLLPAFGIIDRHIAFWFAAFTLVLALVSRIRSESAIFCCLNLFPLLVTLAIFAQR